MQVTVGTDAKSGQPVVLDTLKAINAHLQISALTGIGKTYQITALVTAIVESASELQQPLRVHVMNPHGDLSGMAYSSEVLFSAATRYGYNPLEINPDPDYGGVSQTIEQFIAAVRKQKAVGTKQEAVMRYLLEDLYASRGFKTDDPRTWIPDDPRLVREMMQGKEGRVYLNVDAALEYRTRFKELLKERGARGGFDSFDDDPDMRQKKCWWIDADHYDGDFLMWEPKSLFKTAPTIDDLVRFTERKLKAQYCGTNSAAIALLKDVNEAARAYHRKVGELSRRGAVLSEPEKKELQAGLEKTKEKAGRAYSSYLNAIVTGRELDDLIRYSSTDVLTSVYERFQNLRAIGIYNPVPPPFDPMMPVRIYSIKPLPIPVQRMFVDMVCARIFERAMQRGIQQDVVEIIVLDEGKRYVTEDDTDILSTIANEARKFGLGLWIASQSPGHFTDDFLKSTGTILVLGLAKADTNLAARKLGIDERLLGGITPQKTALIQMKNKGELSSDFQMVRLA